MEINIKQTKSEEFPNITEMHKFIKKNKLEKSIDSVDSHSVPGTIILKYFENGD